MRDGGLNLTSGRSVLDRAAEHQEAMMGRFATFATALAALAAAGSAHAQAPGPTGLNVAVGDPRRGDQEYGWRRSASTPPRVVGRVYPGLEAARKALNVKVRIAGPTSVDLAAFI